jgi:transcriptional regulator with XRE-family HTH domain
VLGLTDLRESLGVTQAQLAGSLGVSQPNISKIERNDDLYLSTLGGYVAALGGRLEVRAVFPDHPEHDVSIALPGGSEDRPPPER